MPKIATWAVRLSVHGSIKVIGTQKLEIFKGFRVNNYPFYSNVELRSTPYGIEATVTAFASTSDLAHKAALIFFGQMLDVLSIHIKQPLYLSFTSHSSVRAKEYTVLRIIEKEEWDMAFHESLQLSDLEPTYLRALGWYRKGLYTEDPFDKFLAFWNSIEITATKYRPDTEESKKGSKNQIWACFETLWGSCDHWPGGIRNDKKWVDHFYETRKKIAHGISAINVREIELVLEQLPKLEEVASNFLTDFKCKQLKLDDFSRYLESLESKNAT
jgi:hypothetical protein